MLKNIGLLLIAGGMAIASPSAMAIENYYVGASVIRVTDKGDEAPGIYPVAAGIRAGITVNEHFAVEARYATGVSSDSANFGGLPVDLELDHLYGAYMKGIIPVGRVSPYVLVGYTHGQETFRVKALGLSASDSDSKPSFGIGMDVPLGDKWSLNVEWARLLKGQDDLGVGYKIESLSVGGAYHFK